MQARPRTNLGDDSDLTARGRSFRDRGTQVDLRTAAEAKPDGDIVDAIADRFDPSTRIDASEAWTARASFRVGGEPTQKGEGGEHYRPESRLENPSVPDQCHCAEHRKSRHQRSEGQG